MFRNVSKSMHISCETLKCFTRNMHGFHIFGENHGLTPLENVHFSDYIPCMFLEAGKDFFLLRTSPNII